MTDSRTSTTEAAIVGRLMKPDKGDFSPEAARELLSLRFGETDQRRMGELSLKSQEGEALVGRRGRSRVLSPGWLLAGGALVQGAAFSQKR